MLARWRAMHAMKTVAHTPAAAIQAVWSMDRTTCMTSDPSTSVFSSIISSCSASR